MRKELLDAILVITAFLRIRVETEVYALSRRKRAAVVWGKETELANRMMEQRRSQNLHMNNWVSVNHGGHLNQRHQFRSEEGRS
jgi:hypothetical protein